jgi:hypothetical protein
VLEHGYTSIDIGLRYDMWAGTRFIKQRASLQLCRKDLREPARRGTLDITTA